MDETIDLAWEFLEETSTLERVLLVSYIIFVLIIISLYLVDYYLAPKCEGCKGRCAGFCPGKATVKLSCGHIICRGCWEPSRIKDCNCHSGLFAKLEKGELDGSEKAFAEAIHRAYHSRPFCEQCGGKTNAPLRWVSGFCQICDQKTILIDEDVRNYEKLPQVTVNLRKEEESLNLDY